ncbi:MAG: sugar nucleotide-binding protein [Elioraea tepidiphila]
MNLASPETAITDWLATQKQAMLDLIERLVNTDSGSYDKPGVDAVGAQIKAFFDSHGIAVETIPGATKGDVLRAVLPESRDFARAIMAEAGLPCRINDIPTAEYPTPAQRPLNSRLDCRAFTDAFGIPRPDWRAGLAAIVQELRP